MHRGRPSAWATALVIGLLLMSCTPSWAQRWWSEMGTGPQPSVQTLPDFITLANRLSPTVVNVSAETRSSPTLDLPQDLSPFDQFAPHRTESVGSGFILTTDGYILTNEHVIAGAREITVTLSNRRSFAARVVGRDPKTDIALLKIDAGTPLPVAPLGNSDDLRVGQWVMAIGNPFGFDHSVTVGIVSAKGRFIPGNYDDFIQTDASINPGNSGGPLIDLRGEVVGINSAIYTRTGASMGIGFAIPVNLVKPELGQLRTRGKVTRGWLGVYIQQVTPPLAQALGLAVPQGALVSQVLPDSPAQIAGIRRGDVITAYDHQPVQDSQELPLLVARTPLARSVVLEVLRDGRDRRITVTITASREDALIKSRTTDQMPAAPHQAVGLGLKVEELTPKLEHELGLSAPQGVVVTGVRAGSAAEDAGLQRRDLILEINRRPVNSLSSYQQALAAAHSGSLLLLIQRADSTLFVPLVRQE
ncbi:MAG TPA: DegQ family serine endoprotease [Candidatus Binataceae bacterium]|nr:DegQ family serine endoprotease [Candidatus Binataceae bacterium]